MHGWDREERKIHPLFIFVWTCCKNILKIYRYARNTKKYFILNRYNYIINRYVNLANFYIFFILFKIVISLLEYTTRHELFKFFFLIAHGYIQKMKEIKLCNERLNLCTNVKKKMEIALSNSNFKEKIYLCLFFRSNAYLKITSNVYRLKAMIFFLISCPIRYDGNKTR